MLHHSPGRLPVNDTAAMITLLMDEHTQRNAYELQESAIYAVALFRGNLELYGQPVAVNFSDRGSVPSLTESQMMLWRKCQAVLAQPGLASNRRAPAGQHAPYVLQSLQ